MPDEGFISSVPSQISHLVGNLTKKNYKSNVAELHNLTDLYGEETNVLLLQALVTSFGEEGKSVNQKDSFRIQLFTQEVSALSTKDNFVTVLCRAFEGLGPTEDLLLAPLSRVLKLSLAHELLLGTALCSSSNMELRQHGVNFLKSKLSALVRGGPNILSNNLAHHLLYCVRTMEEFEAEAPAVVASLTPHFVNEPGFDPLLEDSNVGDFRNPERGEAETRQLSSMVGDARSLGQTMLDFGYSCTSSLEVCSEFVSSFRNVSEEDVAIAVGVMIRSHSGLSTEVPFIAKAPFDPDRDISNAEVDTSTWNVENFVKTVKRHLPSLQWVRVFQHLDHPGFCVPDVRALQMLMEIFRAATEVPFPMNVPFGRWNNAAGQVSLLEQAIVAPADIFSFAASPRRQDAVDVAGGKGSKGSSQNSAWHSLDLIETLLELSDSQHYTTIRKMFEVPITQCPDLLLLGLAQTKPVWNTLLTELVSTLVPMFVGNHPSSTAILHRLWAMRPDMVTLGLAELYQRESSNLSRILDVAQDLKALAEMLDARPFFFVIDLAALASRREYLNLEKWLVDQSSKHKVPFIQACLDYLAHKTKSMQDGNTKGHLTLDIVAVFFKCLHLVSSSVPRGLAESIKQLHAECATANPQLLSYAPGPESQRTFSASVEDEANMYFQKIYTNQLTIEDVINMLKRFQNSPNSREKEIFACMIHNLFDEYRFFPKYPDKELVLTGVLFGSLINHGLVSRDIPVHTALRCVLDALRHPYHSKMFKFGLFALKQFKMRLREFPQVCQHIVQIPHVRENHPDVVQFIERVLAEPLDGSGVAQAQQLGEPLGPQDSRPRANSNNRPLGFPRPRANSNTRSGPLAQQGVHGRQAPGSSGGPKGSGGGPKGSGGGHQGGGSSGGGGGGGGSGGGGHHGGSGGGGAAGGSGQPPNGGPPGGPPGGGDPPSFPNTLNVDSLMENPSEVPDLDEATKDKIHFIFNNVSLSMMDQKVAELKSFLSPMHFPYLCHYLVVKRASVEANLHSLYLALLDAIDSKALFAAVRLTTIEKVKLLLKSDKIKSSSSERSLLKNLGSWLGQLTLARNKPLFHLDLPLKELIIDAYRQGRLIAVIPFVAKILEACAKSKVFEPPNPWVMAIIRVLAELYALPNLKLNLKFEVQVLCKRINLDINEVNPSDFLSRVVVDHTSNYDFSNRQPPPGEDAGHPEDPRGSNRSTGSEPPRRDSRGRGEGPMSFSTDAHNVPHNPNVPYQPGAGSVPPGGQGGPAGAASDGLVPNLSAYLQINRSVVLFQQHPHLKRCVPIAMDRAIREIISPVVERSVTIACISTRELIRKDFAMESDEKKMRHAAHLMVQNLAGSLASVTCKEPLRVSMSNHLLNLLQANTSEQQQALVEEAVQVVSQENLELACMLIEKAATEKAVRDIDETLARALTVRRKHRERTGQPYFDMSIFTSGRYPSSLPDHLRPLPGGLQPQQQRVYDDFAMRSTRQPAFERQHDGVPVDLPSKRPSQGSEADGSVNAARALVEKFQQLTTQVERAAVAVARSSATMSGTVLEGVPLDTLPPDHDISMLLQKIPGLAAQARTHDIVVSMAQTVLAHQGDNDAALLVHVHVAALKMLRDVCKSKFPKCDLIKEFTNMYLFADEERRMHPTVSIHLVLGGVLLVAPFDQHMGNMVDNARQQQSVDAIAHIVRQCVLDHGVVTQAEFKTVIEALQKHVVSPRGGTKAQSSMRLLDDLRSAGEESASRKQVAKIVEVPVRPESLTDPAGLREQVSAVFEEWLQVCVQPPSDKANMSILNKLQQRGLLKGDDTATRFFRILVELAVDSGRTAPPQEMHKGVDAFSKLILMIVKHHGPQAQAQTPSAANAAAAAKMSMIAKVLGVIGGVLRGDAERPDFNQRSYFRLFAVLMSDFGALNAALEPISFQILQGFSSTYHDLRPARVPAFAFAWLELVSHRTFMPKLLLAKPQKGWNLFQRLLSDLFTFLEPFLRTAALNEPIQLLYKGSLRVLLVLLHDFPEFLCDYHFSFCDLIPPSCIQMRNLILSAFPHNMRLPDPFTPNLKVDLLPEINQSPRILSPYKTALEAHGLKQDLDTYLKARGPPPFLQDLPRVLLLTPQQAKAAGTAYNVPLVNSLVLYVGVQAVAQMQSSKMSTPISHSASMDIFQKLVTDLDTEGRYLVLNAIANQLRYPNNHTHYFSCVLLFLFARKENQEIIQEQITRVLLERLIVNRPHPWGLLITFIELIKNPLYNFWRHSFTRCAPEIERLFESVARSCMGHVSKTDEHAAQE